ncbi:MAG: hypothetical protein AUK28_00975 [Desulfobacterales bacterium CG2_30_60_27]|nr:MAG: hypothetical protein AUK28_00975 [Desulfobacterales bacterium CG2_30_60_27]
MRLSIFQKVFAVFFSLCCLTLLLVVVVVFGVRELRDVSNEAGVVKDFSFQVQKLETFQLGLSGAREPGDFEAEFGKAVQLVAAMRGFPNTLGQELRTRLQSVEEFLGYYRQAYHELTAKYEFDKRAHLAATILDKEVLQKIHQLPDEKRYDLDDLFLHMQYEHDGAYHERNPARIANLRALKEKVGRLTRDAVLLENAAKLLLDAEAVYLNFLGIVDREKFLQATATHFSRFAADTIRVVAESRLRKQALLLRVVAGFACAAVLLTFFLWFITASYFKKFLRHQQQAITAIKASRYDYEAPMVPDDEIGDLTLFMKDMAASLQQSLQQQRDSATRYQQLIESIFDWVWEVDAEGVYTYASPRVLDFLGYTPAEVVGRTPFNFMEQAEATRMSALFAASAAGRQPLVALVNRHVHKDGRPVIVETSATPILDRDGHLSGYRGVARNITERIQAQEKARLAGEEWAQTFDAIADIVTIQNGDLRIHRANRAACEVLKKTQDEIIGMHCYELFRGATEVCAGCPAEQAVQGLQAASHEMYHPALDKSFLVSMAPIRDAQGRVVSIAHFAKDITQQKKLEGQFLQAQKMEAIGRLSGGVAHDFNNLLTTIIGYSELLLMDMQEDERRRGEIEAIYEAGQRAAGLTRQLLAFSRKQVMEMRPVDLNDIVTNLTKMLSRMIGEDVELQVTLCPGATTVLADIAQVEQILMNLAVNAKDAMPNGGRLSIGTKTVELGAESVDLDVELAPGSYVLLTVADSGEGMPAEVLTHIFEPFFTTKEKGKGTGLGLATVYGIVKQHQGHILGASEPGQGATFKIYFPRVAEVVEHVEAVQAEELPRGSQTVLVVDDEPGILKMVARILERQGYQVLSAASGAEALAASQAFAGGIDLLLTDVVMPGMDGQKLARVLKVERPEIRVCFMSGYTDRTIVEQGILASGMHFIHKPLTPSGLAVKLRKILDN